MFSGDFWVRVFWLVYCFRVVSLIFGFWFDFGRRVCIVVAASFVVVGGAYLWVGDIELADLGALIVMGFWILWFGLVRFWCFGLMLFVVCGLVVWLAGVFVVIRDCL